VSHGSWLPNLDRLERDQRQPTLSPAARDDRQLRSSNLPVDLKCQPTITQLHQRPSLPSLPVHCVGSAIPAQSQSDEYRQRRRAIDEQFQEARDATFEELRNNAESRLAPERFRSVFAPASPRDGRHTHCSRTEIFREPSFAMTTLFRRPHCDRRCRQGMRHCDRFQLKDNQGFLAGFRDTVSRIGNLSAMRVVYLTFKTDSHLKRSRFERGFKELEDKTIVY
jgi:hypothetical protein